MQTIIAAAVGAAAAIVVTRRLHAADGFWAHRVGRSRFRRANLPVGGAIAAAAAILFPSLAAPLLAAAATMTVTAIGWLYIDPLPPLAR